MDAQFGTQFMNGEYKKHRETVLLDRERVLLPATQDRLSNYRQYTSLMENIPTKKKKLTELRKEINALAMEVADETTVANRLKRRMFADAPTRNVVEDVDIDLANLHDDPPTGAAPHAKRVVRGCPFDDCRGFLYDDFACGTCGKKACAACHEIKIDDGHVCVPENVSAAKLIMRDSKPCPSCAVLIHRTQGCAQMWCTQCHATFNWNTGKIETGIIHNPHYYAWANRNGNVDRNEAVGGGGNCQYQWWTISRRLSDHRIDNDLRDRLAGVHRRSGHLQNITLPTLADRFNERDNLDLRLRFMNAEITESELKEKLQRREKKRTKEVAVRQVYEMYVTATQDIIMNRIMNRDAVSNDSVSAALTELAALEKYADVELTKIGKRFNMKIVSIMNAGRPPRRRVDA